MRITADTTSVRMDVVLRLLGTNEEVVGKVAGDCTASYWRAGGTPTSITLVALSAITDAYTSGGFLEADAALEPGSYRLDVPDAAFAAGAPWVEVNVKCSGAFVFKERVELDAIGDSGLATLIGAVSPTAIAAEVFATPVPGAFAAGTAGQIIGDRIVASVTGAVGSVTDRTDFRLSAAGVSDILATPLTESYAADGAPATLAQLLYMLWAAAAAEKVVSGTTMSVKSLNGTTTVMTFTLNSAVSPTSITRTT